MKFKRTRTEFQKKAWLDKRCTIVILATIMSNLFTLVSWIILLFSGSVFETRKNPFYLAFMLPFVYWAVQLASYAPGPVRFLKTAIFLGPALGALALATAYWKNETEISAWIVLFSGGVIFTMISALAMRGSFLEAEVGSLWRLRR